MATSGGDGRRATVLVVEDDPILRRLLAYNLERDGYRVLTAADGAGALATARGEAGGLDLVLLDLMLPGVDGFGVLARLRRDADVPVLILSARDDDHAKAAALALGAADYLAKSFALRELLDRVRAAVRRRPTAP